MAGTSSSAYRPIEAAAAGRLRMRWMRLHRLPRFAPPPPPTPSPSPDACFSLDLLATFGSVFTGNCAAGKLRACGAHESPMAFILRRIQGQA